MNYEIEKTIQQLYDNNQYKLKRICNKEMAKFGGLSQKDYDGFYSRAGQEIAIAIYNKKYDPTKGKTPLDFFVGVIKRAVWKEMTDKNRGKRQIILEVEDEDENGNIVKKKEYIPTVSIDMPIGDENGKTLGDTLQSDFNMEKIFESDTYNFYDEKIEKYLDSLPKITRKIVEMKMNDVSVSIIKEKLKLTEKEYSAHMNNARMNENIALFTKRSNRCKEEYNKMDNIIPIDVTDNYRMDKFPLGGLLDDMRDGKINKKHILQRKPFQWTERQKNKFLTRVLNGQPIPEIVICEQTVKGKKKSHLIDGLQRLSYSELFRADGIVVKIDGAEFYEIPYREYKHDNDGNILLDEEGDALFEEKIFNVIGKKFSEFPQFLKDRFNKFNINVTTYFNCTDDQIAYHIRNYNNQEGMNKSQYEFTGIDIDVANRIKDISEKHPFFKDCYGKYTEKNKIKGDIDKVVVESIMACNFIENWKKDVKDSYSYINEHVTNIMFDSLEHTLHQLCGIVDKEIKSVFTTTNSPVWFAVFDEFKTLGLPAERFKEFVNYINASLETLELDGNLFIDTYKNKNTRDKRIVFGKVKGLISLMYGFLHIENSDNEITDAGIFISENLGVDKCSVKDDLEVYIETLNDLKERSIRDGSKLLDAENELSLLAMVAYSYKTDQDLDSWLKEYAEKNNTYFINQKKNFVHMKQDFDRYCRDNKDGA
ncbi:MAG: DUF262 domain-containing protein [Lachnospiraceae bacterium]|nr:DUF262 domain-containing protein [Lachnospiraceae bacterium]